MPDAFRHKEFARFAANKKAGARPANPTTSVWYLTMAHYYFENKPQRSGKSGEKIASSLHHDYICREKQYAGIRGREEDLVYKASGNLPVWTKGDANAFWSACEEYKPKNYRAYREFKFSLQEELSLEDNIAMVNTLIEQSGIATNHAYTFAIHDKPAAFDPEHRNIHCHLMFNEKIIEPERPLAAENYFAKYAENRAGEPTGGLRTSLEFISKQKTFELRTMWADIVNAKFAERGINASVDERTLVAQKEELLALDRSEEAEYFDREPAPHLGSAYLNPKTMEKIREKIEELENGTVSDEYNFEDDLTDEVDATDKKILAFAKDFVLRKIGKEIQRERERIHAEMQEDKERAEAVEELSYAVTAGDLTERLTVLTADAEAAAKALLEEYDKVQKSIVKDDYIDTEAAYAALGEEGETYRILRSDYSAVLKELKTAEEARDTALARAQSLRGDIASVTEWQAEKEKAFAAKKQVSLLYAKRTELGKQIAAFKGRLAAPEKAILAAEYADEIRDNNKLAKEKANQIYKKYRAGKNRAARYTDVLKDLSKLDTKTVIFASKIPPVLKPSTKLLGTVPLTDFDKIAAGKKTYFVIKRNDKSDTALAVKLNDDMIRGKVPVYTITLTKNENGKEDVKTVKETGKISTYAQKETLKKQTGKAEYRTAAGAVIERKINEIADKITENKNILIDAYWQEERAAIHDKLQEAERRLTQGWSL